MAQLRNRRLLPRSTATATRARGSVGSALLVLTGAALFGTVGTAQVLGPDVPPAELAAARLGLAGFLFLVLALAAGHRGRLVGALRHPPVWWAAVGQAGFNLCFLGAMREAGVAVGTLVAIGATPVLTGLATRRVSAAWLRATAVAVAGLALLVGAQTSAAPESTGRPSPLGVALAVGAAASYAAYIIAGNAAARRLEAPVVLGVGFTLAGMVTAPLLVAGDVGWVLTGHGALLVAFLAVVPTVAAYQCFNRGLAGVRPSTASTLGLVEPVVAAVLAYLVLGERLDLLGALGACTILGGLLMVVRTLGDGAGHEGWDNRPRG